MTRWRAVIDKASRWLGTEKNGQWLEDMRGNLALVATVIATMTFQVALNPPGGFVQSGENGFVDCPPGWDYNASLACPGDAIIGAKYVAYHNFLLCNSISFFSSLLVCIWVVCGLPLRCRVLTCLLALGMCVSLTSLALTYFYGVGMITADYKDCKVAKSSIKFFFGVVGGVGFLLVLRVVLLFVAIFTERRTPSAAPRENDHQNQASGP